MSARPLALCGVLFHMLAGVMRNREGDGNKDSI